MIYVTGILVLSLALTAEATVGDSANVAFCKETDECLLFDTVCGDMTGDKYQVRHYNSVKWVSTDETTFSMGLAAFRSFRRLFAYINGDNSLGQKITMTSPVVMRSPDKRWYESGVYTMSFLLPSKYQTVAPDPKDNRVYVHDTPDMNVYVKTYDGWMTVYDGAMAEQLSRDLTSARATYKKAHYSAGYNSPMTIFDMHSEVWFEAEGELKCPSG